MLRSAGALFALPPAEPPASPSKGASTDAQTGANEETPAEPRTISDLALKYSKLATRVVESVGEEVRSINDTVSLGTGAY